MNFNIIGIKFLGILILMVSGFSGLGQIGEQTNQVILKLKTESRSIEKTYAMQNLTGNDVIDQINNDYNPIEVKRQQLGRNSNDHIYIIQFPDDVNIQQVIEEYNKSGEVEYAEPDYIGRGAGMSSISPDDLYYERQWGMNNDGSFALSHAIPGADISMEKAWEIEQGDSNIVLAIIDSGARLNHPEFEGRLWINHNEIENSGNDDDNNGYIDDRFGWNFVSGNNNPTDDHGHGTNVAGIAGANGNNGIGYAGVDWNCKLMILKALDNMNQGFYSWWIDAIYYAVDNGANVINMSMGGTGYSTTLHNAINYALSNEVVIVASMMNTNSNTIFYPAAFDGVIAVGSTDPDDTRSSPFFWNPNSGSNYGNHISVVAPGNFMFGLSHQSSVNYNTYWGGTSQASPIVAGLASLLLAQDISRSPAEIKSIIESTADDLVGNPTEDDPGWDPYYGHGRINAERALLYNTVETTILNDIKIDIFPNPSSGPVSIRVFDETNKFYLLDIYNSSGSLIKSSKPFNSSLTLENESLSNGLYIFELRSLADKNLLKRGKFILH